MVQITRSDGKKSKQTGRLRTPSLICFFVPSKNMPCHLMVCPKFSCKSSYFSAKHHSTTAPTTTDKLSLKKLSEKLGKTTFFTFLLIFWSKLYVSWSLTKISWFRDAKNGRDHVKSWSRDFTVQTLVLTTTNINSFEKIESFFLVLMDWALSPVLKKGHFFECFGKL